jgi:uncharacterized OB-fold protein
MKAILATTKLARSRRSQGRCTQCGKVSDYASCCAACNARNSEIVRRKAGWKPWRKGGAGRPPLAVDDRS